MSFLDTLKKLNNLKDVATFLGCKPQALSYLLFFDKEKYRTFEIKKRNGGIRIIKAPNKKLKAIQKLLSAILYECYAEIYPVEKFGVLSHGYVKKTKIEIDESKESKLKKEKSIPYGTISNAVCHKNKRNVLNLDLENFFDSFNFGRVRGFFIKNENFKLHEGCATVLAQIACFENGLPQGSPCSPIIANLIARSLDVKLANFAHRNSATYSRYVDDITFSTNKESFQDKIAFIKKENVIIGKSLSKIINKSGFSINNDKSRIQYSDSRQEVTGLIVNQFVNVPSDYRHALRPMVHSLFKRNVFTIKSSEGIENVGTIDQLNGMLSYIHFVRKNTVNKGKYIRDENGDLKLDGSDQLYADFLFYKYFVNNDKPIVICEGKTDIVYLKSALKSLSLDYPQLISKDGDKTNLNIQILPASKTVQDLLGLLTGAQDLKKFLEVYQVRFKKYSNPRALNPVIVLVDNDDGPRDITNWIKGKYKAESHPGIPLKVWGNLIYVRTPELETTKKTAIEDFFSEGIRKIKVRGKTFSPHVESENVAHYGKKIFAEEVISKMRKSLDFESFKPILDLLVLSLELHQKK